LVMLCQLVDLYFVGGLGDAAIAGVAAASNAGFLINAFTQVLSVGTVSLVSHAVGRKDRTDANLVFNQALGLSFVCGAIALVAGWLLARLYVGALAANEATIEAGTTYMLWFMPALALQFTMLVMSAALRGTGIVRPAMLIQSLTVLINIALAPVLITGWGTGHGFGVAGAGLASSLAVVAGVAMLGVYLNRSGRYLALDPSKWWPSVTQCRRILRIGLPAGGEFAMIFVFMAVIYYALRDLGAAAQAGFGIGTRLMGLIQVPAFAIALAAGPVVGQNFGAGIGDRVRAAFRQVFLLITAIMLVATAFAEWRPQALLGAFTDDADTIAVGATFLRLVGLNLVAQGALFLCTATFQGLGHTLPQLLSSATRLITYSIPILWLSSRSWFGIEYIRYVWYASIVTTSLQALLSLWLLRRELRKRLTPL
jgi:MATE family, multidrug efflux pump